MTSSYSEGVHASRISRGLVAIGRNSHRVVVFSKCSNPSTVLLEMCHYVSYACVWTNCSLVVEMQKVLASFLSPYMHSVIVYLLKMHFIHCSCPIFTLPPCTSRTPLKRLPMLGGRELNIYHLYEEVQKRGGSEKVAYMYT